MFFDQRLGSVVGDIAGWGGVGEGWGGVGEGWGVMSNDFIVHVYDKNYLFFFYCMYYITK